MRGVYYRTEKDGTPLQTPELRISATNNRTVYYDNAAARDAAMQAGEIKEGSIVLTGIEDEGGDYVTRNQITPDWQNAAAITSAQLLSGYTAPSNGMIVGVAWKDNSTSEVMFLKLNSVTIAGSMYSTNNDRCFANVQVPVEGGDVLTLTGASTVSSDLSFVPYKA